MKLFLNQFEVPRRARQSHPIIRVVTSLLAGSFSSFDEEGDGFLIRPASRLSLLLFPPASWIQCRERRLSDCRLQAEKDRAVN